MFNRSESFFEGVQKTKLFYQIWEPPQSKGHLVITHGQAEHSGCYHRLVEGIKDLSYTVYAWDLRGHGKSEGQRGYARNFTDYVLDFQQFVEHLRVERELPPQNLNFLGHSMGALIQLRALIENPHWAFKAQALSSPMLGVALEVPLYKDLAALAFSKLWPTLTLNNEIKYEDLTRDAEVIKEFQADFLRHNRISSGVYLGAIAAIESLRHDIHKVTVPTLVQIPSHDPVVGSEEAKALFSKIGAEKKILKVYPDRKHEIYNDLGRDQVYQDLMAFLMSCNPDNNFQKT